MDIPRPHPVAHASDRGNSQDFSVTANDPWDIHDLEPQVQFPRYATLLAAAASIVFVIIGITGSYIVSL